MISCFSYLLVSCVGSKEIIVLRPGTRTIPQQTPSDAPRPLGLCFSPVLQLQAEKEKEYPARVVFFCLQAVALIRCGVAFQADLNPRDLSSHRVCVTDKTRQDKTSPKASVLHPFCIHWFTISSIPFPPYCPIVINPSSTYRKSQL